MDTMNPSEYADSILAGTISAESACVMLTGQVTLARMVGHEYCADRRTKVDGVGRVTFTDTSAMAREAIRKAQWRKLASRLPAGVQVPHPEGAS
jgi:hypothetical protein